MVDQKGRPICTFFLKGTCKKGDNCRFSHETSGKRPENICRWFLAGNCQYGKACRFDHVKPKQISPGDIKVASRGDDVKLSQSKARVKTRDEASSSSGVEQRSASAAAYAAYVGPPSAPAWTSANPGVSVRQPSLSASAAAWSPAIGSGPGTEPAGCNAEELTAEEQYWIEQEILAASGGAESAACVDTASSLSGSAAAWSPEYISEAGSQSTTYNPGELTAEELYWMEQEMLAEVGDGNENTNICAEELLWLEHEMAATQITQPRSTSTSTSIEQVDLSTEEETWLAEQMGAAQFSAPPVTQGPQAKPKKLTLATIAKMQKAESLPSTQSTAALSQAQVISPREAQPAVYSLQVKPKKVTLGAIAKMQKRGATPCSETMTPIPQAMSEAEDAMPTTTVPVASKPPASEIDEEEMLREMEAFEASLLTECFDDVADIAEVVDVGLSAEEQHWIEQEMSGGVTSSVGPDNQSDALDRTCIPCGSSEPDLISRSASMECSVCMEVVLEKPKYADRRFGILEACSHTFCLQCVRNWRSSGAGDKESLLSCPTCRKKSNFVVPSKFYVADGPAKSELIAQYKASLANKHCTYFNRGEGTCPFGSSCWYRHELPDGTLEVSRPRYRAGADGEVEPMQNVTYAAFLDTR